MIHPDDLFGFGFAEIPAASNVPAATAAVPIDGADGRIWFLFEVLKIG